jgi:hypothetical protein
VRRFSPEGRRARGPALGEQRSRASASPSRRSITREPDCLRDRRRHSRPTILPDCIRTLLEPSGPGIQWFLVQQGYQTTRLDVADKIAVGNMNIRATCVNEKCSSRGVEKSVAVGKLVGYGAKNERVKCPECGALLQTTKTTPASELRSCGNRPTGRSTGRRKAAKRTSRRTTRRNSGRR